jgi:hypothetical protein
LGRFAQADTIVPGGAQGWDRYAYVSNSPMMYVDPSGHSQNCGPDGAFCDQDPSNDHDHDYFVLDISKLSTFRGKTGISGLDFYYWYLTLLSNQDGWWWQLFGQDGEFSIGDAFAVIYVFETQNNWSDPNISEAAIRKANEWCKDPRIYGNPCSSTEEYVNWFAAEYESAGNYVTNPSALHTEYQNYTLSADDVIALQNNGASFANHPAAWNEGCKPMSPCGWANPSTYASQGNVDLANKLTNADPRLFFTVYGKIDPWQIYSGCIYEYWIATGDLSAQCNPVR